MNAVAALPAIWFHVLNVVHVFRCSAVIPVESGTAQTFVQHLFSLCIVASLQRREPSVGFLSVCCSVY